LGDIDQFTYYVDLKLVVEVLACNCGSDWGTGTAVENFNIRNKSCIAKYFSVTLSKGFGDVAQW
jgi:hypothetical protein